MAGDAENVFEYGDFLRCHLNVSRISSPQTMEIFELVGRARRLAVVVGTITATAKAIDVMNSTNSAETASKRTKESMVVVFKAPRTKGDAVKLLRNQTVRIEYFFFQRDEGSEIEFARLVVVGTSLYPKRRKEKKKCSSEVSSSRCDNASPDR